MLQTFLGVKNTSSVDLLVPLNKSISLSLHLSRTFKLSC